MDSAVNTISSPLESFLQPLLGSLGSQLPNVLVTLLILFVGIFIAKIVRIGIKNTHQQYWFWEKNKQQ